MMVTFEVQLDPETLLEFVGPGEKLKTEFSSIELGQMWAALKAFHQEIEKYGYTRYQMWVNQESYTP